MSDDSAVGEALVVCGPTAAGKSAIAMWIADHVFGRTGESTATIISADSRQVYRGFDIGTAKPTTEDRARVRHFGLDVANPTERYSAAAWADAAATWLEKAFASANTPIVVGGTGLYLRALFEGLFDQPPLDTARRAQLEPVLADMDVAELRRWASVLDPDRAHLGRTQLLRAIEIALLTGTRLSRLQRDRARPTRWQARYLLVDPGPALATRISARIDEMLDHGWPDEVQRLMQTVPADAPAWNATGYDAVRRLVREEQSRETVREQILIETRQYAKRQRTWFRHQLPAERVTRVNPLASDWTDTVERWAAAALDRMRL